jgi:predicted transcriptional regulator
MVTVDTIAMVRRAYFVQKRKIKAIARDLRLARDTVREIIRADEQPERARPGATTVEGQVAALEHMLSKNAQQPKRARPRRAYLARA